MKKLLRSLHAVFTLVAAAFGLTTAAHAQTVITSLPYTITAKGLYVLNNDLNAPVTVGNLIQINASNVTIDFQGHYIAGPTTGSNGTTGIFANEQSNLTIKNGTIAFCATGIEIDGNGTATTNSVDHQVDNMRITYCVNVGIAIYKGPASRISNCQVSQTGSATSSSSYAIATQGNGVVVTGNIVSTVTATTGYGIFTNGACFADKNRVLGCAVGFFGGKCQDNLTFNCTTPFSAITDAGGNN